MFKSFVKLAFMALIATPVVAQELRDPMAPFGVRSTASGTPKNRLVLTGIIIGSQRRVAIINDQTHRVGSSVGDYKITAIKKRSVEISNESGTRELVLETQLPESLDETE